VNRHQDSMFDTAPSFKMIQLMTGFWLSRAIYVAAKLGIADVLQEEPKDIDELAKATGSHEPSLTASCVRSPARGSSPKMNREGLRSRCWRPRCGLTCEARFGLG
jgi:hypothetical protein